MGTGVAKIVVSNSLKFHTSCLKFNAVWTLHLHRGGPLVLLLSLSLSTESFSWIFFEGMCQTITMSMFSLGSASNFLSWLIDMKCETHLLPRGAPSCLAEGHCATFTLRSHWKIRSHDVDQVSLHSWSNHAKSHRHDISGLCGPVLISGRAANCEPQTEMTCVYNNRFSTIGCLMPIFKRLSPLLKHRRDEWTRHKLGVKTQILNQSQNSRRRRFLALKCSSFSKCLRRHLWNCC